VFTVRVLGFGDEPASGGPGAGEVRGAAATKVGYDAEQPGAGAGARCAGRCAEGEAHGRGTAFAGAMKTGAVARLYMKFL
jgi:hypothetical protein